MIKPKHIKLLPKLLMLSADFEISKDMNVLMQRMPGNGDRMDIMFHITYDGNQYEFNYPVQTAKRLIMYYSI